MICVIVKVKAKTGQRSQLLAVALEMAQAVGANEPGNQLFTVGEGADPDSIVFVERYTDEAAIEAHRGTPHFKEIGRRMGAFMDGRPEVQHRFVEAG